MRTNAWCLASAVAAVTLAAGVSSAATLRPGFSETVVVSGLVAPTAMVVTPDGRIFVALQGGAVRVVKDGALLPTPLLTVTVNASGERGLIGLALDPQFPVNGFVYVHYTATTPSIHNRVSRFTTSNDTATPGSEVVLLDLPTLGATNHNGGGIHFGPDGLLYIGVGENAVGANAQSLSSPLGKVLRIARDGSIPASNPFFGATTGINRAIWALGLRNPFTFAFDPASGRMLINDVGEGTWEEIDEGLAAANYGWPITEGPATDPRFTPPLFAYSHATGACAITGAAFYPIFPSQFPDEYSGDYFFADLCGGWIGQYDTATGRATLDFATGIAMPVDLALALDGALYYLDRTGRLVRINYSSNTAPVIVQPPLSQVVSIGQSAAFVVTVSGKAPVSYQWLRNETAIPGATGATYTIGAVTADDNGARISVRVSNADGQVTSDVATVTILTTLIPKARSTTGTSEQTGKVARPRN